MSLAVQKRNQLVGYPIYSFLTRRLSFVSRGSVRRLFFVDVSDHLPKRKKWRWKHLIKPILSKLTFQNDLDSVALILRPPDEEIFIYCFRLIYFRAIFKRLRSIPSNKVSQVFSLVQYF